MNLKHKCYNEVDLYESDNNRFEYLYLLILPDACTSIYYQS